MKKTRHYKHKTAFSINLETFDELSFNLIHNRVSNNKKKLLPTEPSARCKVDTLYYIQKRHDFTWNKEQLKQ